MSNSSQQQPPHLALIPSAGMGHLNPFCRLAALLSDRSCTVSMITARPTVSLAESVGISQLLDLFPSIHSLDLPLVELPLSEFPSSSDPFLLRFEALRRSAHLLPPLLVADVSALVVDISLASTFVPIANSLNIPCYILFISSAAMLSLCAHFPAYIAARTTVADIDIPGLWTVPKSSVPPPLLKPNHLFTVQFVENGRILRKSAGILVNTFQALEPEPLSALNDLPPVFDVGLFRPLPKPSNQNTCSQIAWLDKQPEKSVVYVGFGNRTAMTVEQIREMGVGLERSGQRFLWAIKTNKVDREEEDTESEKLLGEGYMERVKDRGMVTRGWAEQEEILSHRAVGGFLSHCGWNSVTETAMAGVRVLGWPRGGDQRVNAGVVRRSGIGIWMEEWSWEADGDERVVRGEEIAVKVKEMMEDQELMRSAERVREEAWRAVEGGGSSDGRLDEFIARLSTIM